MINVHILGITTTTGYYLKKKFNNKNKKYRFFGYSRKINKYKPIDFRYSKISNLNLSTNNFLVSCGPIWEFSQFILNSYNYEKELFKKINSIIVCSSTSVITKRFAYNDFDKSLASKLKKSEDALLELCDKLKIKCYILRPTMIYGCGGNYQDKNIKIILKIMKFLPFIFIPKSTGLRQPIHAKQFSNYIYYLLEKCYEKEEIHQENEIINLGGDEELTYKKMLIRLRNSFPKNDQINSCKLIEIPSSLFFILITPLMLFSPKIYEAFLRLNSNLSGFSKVSALLNRKFETFPIKPFIK